MAGSRRGAFSGRQASPDRLARTIVAHRARLLAGLLLLCCAAALGWRPLSGGGPGAQQAREGAPGELQQAQRHLVLPGGRRSAAELVAAAGVLANPVQPAAAAAVSASAGVHGFVEKQGPADLHNWHPQYKAFREARLAGWMREREDALAQGASR